MVLGCGGGGEGLDQGEDDPDLGPRCPGGGIVLAVERLGGSAVHIPAAQARKGARCQDMPR